MNENTVLYQSIENAMIQPYAEEMAALPDADCGFSRKYRKKRSRLIKEHNRLIKERYRIGSPHVRIPLRKTAVIAAAMILLSATAVTASPQLDEYNTSLFVYDDGKGANIYASCDDPIEDIDINFELHEPAYIPEGLVEINRIDAISAFFIEYEFGDNCISYDQSALPTGFWINTENMNTEYMDINGYEAFISYNDGSTILVWRDEYYLYCISGELNKNETIKMANSVKATK